MSATLIIPNVSVGFFHEGQWLTANKSHAQYVAIETAVGTGDFDTAAKLISLKGAVTTAITGSNLRLVGNNLVYKGEVVRGILGKRLLEMIRLGHNCKPLEAFLGNLMQNPSSRAVDELYGFLEASQLPITDDGYFLAYKSVRQDFTDHHTGTMDNSIGSVVEMPRNTVDEDKDRTCSRGLHFAAHEYASNFGSHGRMVVLKINPKDVVAIPSDYKNQKGRACKYTILEEVKRSDKKLVNAQVVPQKKDKVLDLSTLRVGQYYEFSGNLSVFNSSLIQDGKFIAEYLGDACILVSGYKQWFNDPSSRTGLIAKEVKKPYEPQVDNYADTTLWDYHVGLLTFQGTAGEFPVNRDVPYILERASDSKEYRGEFYLLEYQEKHDNLVFGRYNPKGEIERYVTIADVSDWFIQRNIEAS